MSWTANAKHVQWLDSMQKKKSFKLQFQLITKFIFILFLLKCI